MKKVRPSYQILCYAGISAIRQDFVLQHGSLVQVVKACYYAVLVCSSMVVGKDITQECHVIMYSVANVNTVSLMFRPILIKRLRAIL